MSRYIDADKLINDLLKSSPIDWNNYIADVQEVRHGRWEYIGGYGYKYRCSECIRCAEHKTNYCPNCGTKMDEVDE